RIKGILDSLEKQQREPEGTDEDLIADLQHMVERVAAPAAAPMIEAPTPARDSPEDLERAFRETEVEPPIKPAVADNAPKDDDGAKGANQSIRVTVDTLEHLMTMVSELVLTRNQLLEIVRRHEDSEFKTPLQRLSNVTAELQEGVMKTRMQPIGNAWQKLPRIVRDLCNELGKQIDLEMQGAETELDRQVLDLIKDPLTHMLRNSADHGLETPEERRAAGKPERGRIRLSAWHEGGFIVIQVADDGRGLNTERIKAKALTQGLATEAELAKLGEAQIQKFIFAPGFSTASAVTSISGRGVGMDVVRNNIDQIGGTIDVRSVPGVGVSFTLKIPLTLAIVSALIVEAGGDRFAIPQLAVVELVRAHGGSEHRIERIKDTAVLRLRDKLLPVARLSRLLGVAAPEQFDTGFIVVTQVGAQTFGIVVDAVFHTEEIVVKPMSSKLRHIAMFCGNTILGDGSVIMIIDPNGIAQALGSTATTQLQSAAANDANAVDAVETNTSLLLFRAGSTQPKAVPLALVTRLEEIDARKIELSNGRHMIQYRGQLMPLVSIDDSVKVRSEGAQPLLVFSDGTRSMALIVDEIVDIVEDRLDIEVAGGSAGMLGSAIVKGQATEIIDVGHFLPLAFEDWFRRKEQKVAARRRAVLLVDDSPFFRNMLTPVLQAAGFDVVSVGSAAEALAHVDGGRTVDIVITDIEMPEMDGFALTEALRRHPRGVELPVIGLSSIVSAEAIERGRRVGFHDYVAKFDRQGLIAALKEQSEFGRAA
ncbi:MAG TPA: hybrid sensor histidine kinase/response regulator, partial [Pseudolabrys sp.]